VDIDIYSADYLAQFQLHMLADAQTSGGLLISVSQDKVESLMKALKSNGTLASHIIGEIISKDFRIDDSSVDIL
jgi:selenophosphate synthase